MGDKLTVLSHASLNTGEKVYFVIDFANIINKKFSRLFSSKQFLGAIVTHF